MDSKIKAFALIAMSCTLAACAGCGKQVEAPAISAAEIAAEVERIEDAVQALTIDVAKADYFLPGEYGGVADEWQEAAGKGPTVESLERLREASAHYQSFHDRLIAAAWTSTIGGEGNEEAAAVVALEDGTYRVAGSTTSFGQGQRDVFLVRIDEAGAETARFTYGGSENDSAAALGGLADGGFVVAGRSGSFKDWTGDAYLVRADAEGIERWRQTFGAAGTDTVEFVAPQDEMILAIGNTFKGGGGKNIFLLTLDAAGQVTQETILPGEKDDWVESGVALPDGSIVLAGGRGDLSASDIAFLVLKLDSAGNVIWDQTYDDAGYSVAGLTGIAAWDDGRLVVVGQTKPNEELTEDVVVLGLAADGAVLWRDTVGGDHNEFAGGVTATTAGAAVVAITTESYGAGGSDMLLAKYDAEGTQIWARTLGSEQDESARAIANAQDGGFVVAGERGSFIEGIQDIYVVKTNGDGFSWTGGLFGSTELKEIPHEDTTESQPVDAMKSVAVGDEAPPFRAAEWLNVPDNLRSVLKPDEEIVAEMLGARLIVVEFWATWCMPCKVTVPHLNELALAHANDGIVFVSLTDEARNEAPVDQFMRETNMQSIVGTGSPSGAAFGAYVIPSAYLLDKYGKVRWQGHPMSGLEQAIKELLTHNS